MGRPLGSKNRPKAKPKTERKADFECRDTSSSKSNYKPYYHSKSMKKIGFDCFSTCFMAVMTAIQQLGKGYNRRDYRNYR